MYTYRTYRTLVRLLLVLLAATGCGPTDPVEPPVLTQTMFVGPELVDCVGVAPQKCMLVREDAADEWQYFYDGIRGFDYEPGFTYELRVSRRTITNPPADGSMYEWTLIRIVAKSPV